MTEFPLVSVVTPSYNHAKYIKATIESVCKQTFKNIEYFVIDDGSVDESPQILMDLSKKYNFCFEFQKNVGLTLTMNKLLSMCKGEYVAIIESDDVWTLDKIEKQVAFMEKNPSIGACGGNVLNINGQDEILPYYFQRFTKFKLYDFTDIITFNSFIPALTVLTRKEAFQSIGGYGENLKSIDYYSWLKIAYNKYKIAVLPNLFGFYRVHESNTTKNNKLSLKSKLYILQEYKGKKGYKKGMVKAYIHYYVHCILKIIPKSIFPFRRT
jgi:alpha-1,3-rhamnosyltransferase